MQTLLFGFEYCEHCNAAGAVAVPSQTTLARDSTTRVVAANQTVQVAATWVELGAGDQRHERIVVEDLYYGYSSVLRVQ